MRRAPDVHVYCLCGAQWHGRYAVDNPLIAAHYARQWDRPLVCRLIGRDQFVALGFTDRDRWPARGRSPLGPSTRSASAPASGPRQ